MRLTASKPARCRHLALGRASSFHVKRVGPWTRRSPQPRRQSSRRDITQPTPANLALTPAATPSTSGCSTWNTAGLPPPEPAVGRRRWPVAKRPSEPHARGCSTCNVPPPHAFGASRPGPRTPGQQPHGLPASVPRGTHEAVRPQAYAATAQRIPQRPARSILLFHVEHTPTLCRRAFSHSHFGHQATRRSQPLLAL